MRQPPNTNHQRIYDPEFVSDLFDMCAQNYRLWSLIASFGFVVIWRQQCVGLIEARLRERKLSPEMYEAQIYDLMAGTGEIWPLLLKAFPKSAGICSVDISHEMHVHALENLHSDHADKITHINANVLDMELEAECTDLVIATFGLKTFNKDQQSALARQICYALKPGGCFALIEASDPKGWIFRPLYRFYLERALPLVERFVLKGAQDFAYIGQYTRNFENCDYFANQLEAVGLEVSVKKHFFGCATSVSGSRPDR